MAKPVAVPEVYARDQMIAWFLSEFAAANAIIDALCGHLAVAEGGEQYESVFAALQRRRLNWIPVLHNQKHFPIDEISTEIRLLESNRAAARKRLHLLTTQLEEESYVPSAVQEETSAVAEVIQVDFTEEAQAEEGPSDEATGESIEVAGIEEEAEATANASSGGEDGDASGGSQVEQALLERINISAGNVDFSACPERIKLSKGFVAKESVKGHTVNVVKGLKLYEGIFTDSELHNLVQYINGLRHAGRRGELSGETFIFFNKQMKGNKREIIQFGIPLFQPTSEEAASSIEPIPPALQNIIDNLVLWGIIPDNKKPNSCIINFFDEDDFSQPYFKPPHLENPISTLLLSETTMAFGWSLVSDHEGNYKGSLTLPVNEGTLLVMRGHSADMARHVVCSSPNKRMTITFVKVRTGTHNANPPTALQANQAMMLWRPESPTPQTGGVLAYGPQAMIPAGWGLTPQAPIVMLAQPGEVVMSSCRKSPLHNGTGVFLPWAADPKKNTKQPHPRFRKRRLSFFSSPLEAQA
ncbi:RNA demethylase ALKBH10B-like [Curcuma longa]|uniref:RNA demethylase ALKBH10B-like n=1 Tax=Curcuma longa TaxID=136217 RepID=UPI003D9EC376